MAIKLILHAIQMVFSNFSSAMKIALLPYLLGQVSVLVAFYLALGNFWQSNGELEDLMFQNGLATFWGYFIIAVLFNLLIGAWLAVGWHRFVLLEEYPTGWFPAWHGSNIMLYIGRLILLGLIYFGLAFALGTIAAFIGVALAQSLGMAAAFAPIALAFIVIFWMLTRFSIVLPAAAIGEKLTFGEAWTKTKPFQWSILGAMVIMGIMYYVPSLLMMLVPGNLGLEIVVQAVVGFVIALIGVSFVTTLYGIAVEERELN